MANITVFGTCRLNHIPHNNLNNLITFCHCTKEMIQMIDWMEGRVRIDQPECFRAAIRDKTTVVLTDDIREMWTKSDTVIVEVCSRKKYSMNGKYIHHLCVDPRFPKYYNPDLHHSVEIQTDEEIEHDLLHIHRMIGHHRKFVVVTHYDVEQPIPLRHDLIILLEDVCAKYGWLCINPKKLLSDLTQDEVMTQDLGHYTLLGEQVFTKRFCQTLAIQ